MQALHHQCYMTLRAGSAAALLRVHSTRYALLHVALEATDPSAVRLEGGTHAAFVSGAPLRRQQAIPFLELSQ